MDENIRDLLNEEISSEIKNLSSFRPGSEEQTAAVENLAKLYELRIEETKVELDFKENCERLMDQVWDRYLKLGIEVAGLILPLIFYAHWMRKGFKFEETGTFTSTTFRGLFNRFRPTKR